MPGRANTAPSIAADGNTVAVAWGARAPDGKADVFVATSRDGGQTFGAAVRVNDHVGDARVGGELPPRVALVPRADADPAIAVVWTERQDATSIRITRSEDGGRTFAASRALQKEGAPGDRGWQALTVDSAGGVHTVWLDHRGLAAADGCAHGQHHGHDRASDAKRDGVAMAQRSGLYYAPASARLRSASFGGQGAERELAKGVCYCCKTAFEAAPRNRLFVAWRHVYPGNIRDIAFSTSRDGGGTFSAPARVSRDEWQLDGCPDDGPAMAVDRRGTVHLVWPTLVSKPKPHKALFYSTTRNGQTFTGRVRVSPAGRNIAHPQLAVSGSGIVAVLWDEIVGGQRRVFLSRATNSAIPRFTTPVALAGAVGATYPVAAVVPGTIVVAWTEGDPSTSTIAVQRLPSEGPR